MTTGVVTTKSYLHAQNAVTGVDVKTVFYDGVYLLTVDNPEGTASAGYIGGEGFEALISSRVLGHVAALLAGTYLFQRAWNTNSQSFKCHVLQVDPGFVDQKVLEGAEASHRKTCELDQPLVEVGNKVLENV